jgi:hypothetical protein
VPKKGNAYLDGTVHVGKEVQTIQRYKLEPYMWEKRYKPVTGTVHVGKCFPRNNWYQSYNSTIIEIGLQKSQSGPIAWPNNGTHAWNLIFFGQITSFSVFKNSPYLTSFIKCPRLCPSAYPSQK